MNGLRLISEADGTLLTTYAAKVTIEGTCLEIGSCHGASAMEILAGLPDKYDLVCSSLHGPDDYQTFKLNCVQHGVWNRILPVTGDFRQLAEHVSIKQLAFLFLDHDHSEDGMKDALAMLLPRCVPGCYLLFHDYQNPGYPAVKKYVDEIPTAKFSRVESIDSMAVLQAL